MGWDIVAYFDVDQQELNSFIAQNNINVETLDGCKQIAKYFSDTHLDGERLEPLYMWNDDCGMHEMFEYYRTTFIRDDERFENRRFHQELEKQVGRKFPACLRNINWDLRTKADAIEVASELRVFFPSDTNLMFFADWLETTAKYCSTYELSY